MSAAVAMSWTDPSSLGYPVLFGGVLLGSVVPVVPTGAVVGAAAAVATSSGQLSLPLVLLLATLGAFTGDVLTFAVCRFGGAGAIRWIGRGQHAERLDEVREQFRRHGWQIVVVGRILPAGRIPVLLAAGALGYPWRRLLPASLAACAVWAGAYALLGVVSGGIFDNPLIATLLATLLVLLVGLLLNVVAARRRKHRSPAPPDQVSAPNPGQVSAPNPGPVSAPNPGQVSAPNPGPVSREQPGDADVVVTPATCERA